MSDFFDEETKRRIQAALVRIELEKQAAAELFEAMREPVEQILAPFVMKARALGQDEEDFVHGQIRELGKYLIDCHLTE